MASDCPLYQDCTQCGAKPITDESTVKLYRCSACRLVSYCSKECQLKHWPKHKEMCGKCTQEMKRMRKIESYRDANPMASICEALSVSNNAKLKLN